ncbi:MAG: DNA-binding response regulator [Balneolaceae bacterium]|jgi:DNA-binding response OmpR family regulator|nr:MAG: DNA-binding response regulator [Balneolaceae bacterium]
MGKLDNLSILIVEDDPTVRLLVKKALEHHGGSVFEAENAAEALDMSQKPNLDMIILDLRLPDGNGYDVCIEMRNNGIKTPVLILSADHETDIKVKNLNAGADDYLTKPFSIEELLARIEAIRRRSTISNGTELKCNELKINVIDRQVTIKGVEIDLTNSEFNLLAYLTKNKGKVISLDELAENVWGIDFNTQTNYINVYVSYLRKKIRKHSSFKYIHTVRKQGFKVDCGEA